MNSMQSFVRGTQPLNKFKVGTIPFEPALAPSLQPVYSDPNVPLLTLRKGGKVRIKKVNTVSGDAPAQKQKQKLKIKQTQIVNVHIHGKSRKQNIKPVSRIAPPIPKMQPVLYSLSENMFRSPVALMNQQPNAPNVPNAHVPLNPIQREPEPFRPRMFNPIQVPSASLIPESPVSPVPLFNLPTIADMNKHKDETDGVPLHPQPHMSYINLSTEPNSPIDFHEGKHDTAPNQEISFYEQDRMNRANRRIQIGQRQLIGTEKASHEFAQENERLDAERFMLNKLQNDINAIKSGKGERGLVQLELLTQRYDLHIPLQYKSVEEKANYASTVFSKRISDINREMAKRNPRKK